MGIHNYKGYDNIFYVDKFADELKSLIKDDPNYGRWLNKRLSILNVGAKEATDGDRFEQLKNEDLYSIRRPHSQQNQRVIYYIIDEDNTVILLSAFKEQNNSDYKKFIKLSNNRIDEIRKGRLL